MGTQAAGPGTPVNNEQKIRYQDCWNVSDFDAPPFAAMQRGSGQIVEGRFQWYVSRPDLNTETRQDPNDIVFNGPEVLPSKRPGRCTVDFPARCLHLKSDVITSSLTPNASGNYTASSLVGPRADSWMLWGSKSAFTWLASDDSLDDPDFEAGQVALPTVGYYGASFALGTSGMGNLARNIPASGLIGFTTGINSLAEDGAWYAISVDSRNPFHPDFTLLRRSTTFTNSHSGGGFTPQIPTTAFYEWHFHCSATSPAPAPQGSQIVIQAYADNEQLATYVVRTQQNEIDNYGNEVMRSLENLSMTNVNRFTAGETLNFRNLSAYPVTILAGFCRLRRIP